MLIIIPLTLNYAAAYYQTLKDAPGARRNRKESKVFKTVEIEKTF